MDVEAEFKRAFCTTRPAIVITIQTMPARWALLLPAHATIKKYLEYIYYAVEQSNGGIFNDFNFFRGAFINFVNHELKMERKDAATV